MHRHAHVLPAASLAALAFLALAPSSARATFPGAPGAIAFQGSQVPSSPGQPWLDTGPELLSFNPATMVFTRLTTTAAAVIDADPSWSPDGRRIAFASNRTGTFQVFVANARGSQPVEVDHAAAAAGGSQPVQVTEGAAATDPSWSPDGHHLVVVRKDDLYAIDLDGGNAVNLTRTPNVREAEPAWSPDGTLIAFSSDAGPGRGRMIWTMHADGSNEQELTHAPALDADPDFSPDGSFIAFDQTPLRRDLPPGCQGTCVSLQLMHSDGSDLIGIRREDLAGAVSHPAFSPDGRAMAYVDCVRPFGCRVAASAFDLLRRRPLRRALTVEVPRDSFSSDLMPAWQPLPRAPG